MTSLNPKNDFLANEQDAQAFSKMAHSRHFQGIVQSALTHFCINNLPTQEQLKAVTEFVDVLMGFGDKPKPTEHKPMVPLLKSPTQIEQEIKDKSNKK